MQAKLFSFPPDLGGASTSLSESSCAVELYSVLGTAAEALVIADERGIIQTFEPAAETIWGYSAEEVIGKDFALLLLPHEGRCREEVISKCLVVGEAAPVDTGRKVRGRRKSGKPVQLSLRLHGARLPDGRLFMVILQDKAERQQSERTLSHLATIVESSDDGIVGMELDGTVRSWNLGAERLYGYSADEVVGHSVAMLIPAQSLSKAAGLLKRVARGANVKRHETARMRKDGSTVDVSLNIFPLRDADGTITGVAEVARDISEQKSAEAQIRGLNETLEKRIAQRTSELQKRDEELRMAQKMEALGRLAGGIAHDFNNHLTAILGFTELLCLEDDQSTVVREGLEHIARAANDAASLVSQLLAFSRKQMPEPKVLNPNDILTRMQGMLRPLIREDIALTIDLDAHVGNIKADLGQIEQVVLNLVINARDAMPEGGKIRIVTAAVRNEDRTVVGCRVGQHRPYYASISVSDTGVGMDDATRARIFEPFFTTKEVGKGTGLGLATVYGIVRQSGGDISVDSMPGKGTTFHVYLPCHDGPSEIPSEDEHSEADRPADCPAKSQATILLVEDKDNVRRLVEKVLLRNGYHVLVARDGREAIDLAQSHAGPIRLLISDIVMPNIGGLALAEQLAPTRPEMKVIFMSGYAEEVISVDDSWKSRGTFLSKPFPPRLLESTVHRILEGEPTS